MIHFIFHAPNGSILRTCSTEAMTWDQVENLWPRQPDEVLLQVIEQPQPPDHYYIADGVLVPRETMAPEVSTETITANGLDECEITNLPEGVSVTITGAVTAGPVSVTGGVLTLTSTAAGAITLRAVLDPLYRPWEITINAT